MKTSTDYKAAMARLRVIPELEHHCNSWIIATKSGTAVYEAHNRLTAEAFARKGYQVFTAVQWLVNLNAEIRRAK